MDFRLPAELQPQRHDAGKEQGHVTLRVLLDGPVDRIRVQAELAHWQASCALESRVEFVDDGFWLYLRDAFHEDPAIVACSLQSYLHEQLECEPYVSCCSGACDAVDLRAEMEAAAQAARLLRKTAPIEPDSALRRRGLEMFRQAIDQNRLFAHPQPVVDMRHLGVVGYELLARLFCTQSGLPLPNGLWIPHVVHSHDSLRLAAKMTESAFFWAGGNSTGYTAINLTAADISASRIRCRLLEASSDIRRRIVLELTEWKDALALRNMACIVEQLQQAGYRIALDDFGSGFSSLPLLRAMRFDIIKLDIDLIQSDLASDRHFIDLIVRLADDTRASVVAEGIESEGLRQRMLGHGIVCGQGFYLDRLVYDAQTSTHFAPAVAQASR